jgi:uncharacterized protein (TIGR00251 family)
VYLLPGAKHNAIVEFVPLNTIQPNLQNQRTMMLKVAIHAKPVDNQANTALINFIAEKFKTAKANVSILKGLKTRRKIIHIKGISIREIGNLIALYC